MLAIMKNIKFVRILRGKSQFQLSLLTEIPSYRLSVIENDKVAPTEGELQRLAAALQTTPENLAREVSEDALLIA